MITDSRLPFGDAIEDESPGRPATEILPLDFESHAIRVVMIKGEPWWVASDVCRVLDLDNVTKALSRLDSDEKNTLTISKGIPGNPTHNVVNESGLYSLIFTSRKPEAKRFRKWVTSEVLPEIRRTGSYKGRTDSRLAKTMRRLKSDRKTAEARLENTDQNKAVHGFLHENGSRRGGFAAVHNAVYKAEFGKTCGELKKELGITPG